MSNQEDQQPAVPGSLNDLKILVQQFEMFLPPDKRSVIQNTIAQLEASGGIQSEAQGQQILSQLMQALGLSGLQR
jgi:hypothetical protein